MFLLLFFSCENSFTFFCDYSSKSLASVSAISVLFADHWTIPTPAVSDVVDVGVLMSAAVGAVQLARAVVSATVVAAHWSGAQFGGVTRSTDAASAPAASQAAHRTRRTHSPPAHPCNSRRGDAKLNGNSLDKLRQSRSVAYSVELVLLNKHQISGGGAHLE